MSTAFVTGAGAGIGRATALELARRGYSVGLLDRDGNTANATCGAILTEGGRAAAFAGDVSDERDVIAAVKGTSDALGPIDVAAACAGVEIYGQIVDMDVAEWDRAISINLNGTMYTARHALRSMLACGKGAFVAIASDAGIKAAVDWGPYTVSKHGVVGLVRSLAVDYGPRGVRSNVVCPAMTETAMVDRIFADGHDDKSTWMSKVPLGRFAQAEEVAKVICHLLSDEAAYTNGDIYMVDGGLTAGFGEGKT